MTTIFMKRARQADLSYLIFMAIRRVISTAIAMLTLLKKLIYGLIILWMSLCILVILAGITSNIGSPKQFNGVHYTSESHNFWEPIDYTTPKWESPTKGWKDPTEGWWNIPLQQAWESPAAGWKDPTEGWFP